MIGAKLDPSSSSSLVDRLSYLVEKLINFGAVPPGSGGALSKVFCVNASPREQCDKPFFFSLPFVT